MLFLTKQKKKSGGRLLLCKYLKENIFMACGKETRGKQCRDSDWNVCQVHIQDSLKALMKWNLAFEAVRVCHLDTLLYKSGEFLDRRTFIKRAETPGKAQGLSHKIMVYNHTHDKEMYHLSDWQTLVSAQARQLQPSQQLALKPGKSLINISVRNKTIYKLVPQFPLTPAPFASCISLSCVKAQEISTR